jgi:hypothetical protein
MAGSTSVRTAEQGGRANLKQAGQVLPIFAVMSVVLLGGAALITDVAWWWTNEQQMQRASDAAALAGAVYLPGDQTRAFSSARAEAAKNGYADGIGGVAVTPRRDLSNPRKLIVDIDGSVGTNFARVFCWQGGPCLDHVSIGTRGAAEFILPVPMGSPQNYYGVGTLRDVVEHVSTSTQDQDTGWRPESAVVAGGAWATPGNAATNNDQYATTTVNSSQHQWRVFSLGVPTDPSVLIQGLQVRLTDVFLSSSATSCRVGVEVSWNDGADWSTRVDTSNLGTTSSTDLTVGSASSTGAWGSHAWVPADFSDANFRVRLTRVGTNTNCPTSRTLRVDQLEVRVDYQIDVTTTSTTVESVPVTSPDGATVLTPQGFWGTTQSQGTAAISGDAYMARYDVAKSASNNAHSPESYYHYAIEMRPGSTLGEVWVFDPGFCEVDYQNGTGEHTLGGTGLGTGTSTDPMSTFYELYSDPNSTPYVYSDDTLVASFGDDYADIRHYDSGLGGSSSVGTDCRDLPWHNRWVQLASGLAGGQTYRLHVHTDDATSNQDNTSAYNNFAIYADAQGAVPKVYGLGAMEGYVRLPANTPSEFYLAQIGAEHAGKTMVISLWDAGDTQSLTANLEILKPTAGPYNAGAAYVSTPFNYTASKQSTHSTASNCNSNAGTGVSNVVTNTGGGDSGKRFNGCWLTIEIPVPEDYDAPLPSGEPFATTGGWWKVRYNMGTGSGNATDLTTWQVQLRGNPVHLVPE